MNETNGTGGVLFDVANMTRACISAGGLSEAAEGTWIAEVTDLLLDTWVELLYDHVMLLKW